MQKKTQFTYLIIGRGRMASHMASYLDGLGIPYLHWWRGCGENLLEFAKLCRRRLLLISDDAIEGFLQENPELLDRPCIHFSGALVLPGVYGVHPMQSFTHELYSVEKYRKITFVMEKRDRSFADLLPGLPNIHAVIEPEKKSLYHAACVLGGNFTVLLWQKMLSLLADCGISEEAALPYIQEVQNNVYRDPKAALTGPLTRGDERTIKQNLDALTGDAFKEVYEACVQAYEKEQRENHECTKDLESQAG
ncbi:MAG: hypothetical protein CMO81_07290 [Waddliaceae bacterium]|nr:hypothetical protein [Waddliaceae bacterium]